MAHPRVYLLDEIITYANEQGLSIDKATARLAEFARQRAPELELERKAARAKTEVEAKIEKTESLIISARFFVKTRIHRVGWRYFTEHHVASGIVDLGWFSICFSSPTWKPDKKNGHVYIDDLYHDEEQERFWMKEPYLEELPASKRMFEALTAKAFETLKDTRFRKIDPRIGEKFLETRNASPDYTQQATGDDDLWRRPPYGSAGWKERLALVPSFIRRGWR